MNESKILVVDDEPTLSEVISYNLRQAGYVTVTAADADEALRIFKEEKPDLILLDVMLPQGSGFDVCRLIRQQGNTVPIIMLTARIAESDRVLGFELGADDYILKPFATRELIARVKALLRRSRTTSDENPSTDLLVSATLGMTIDTDKRSVSINGSEVRLSRKEFEVLALMVTHPGRVFERSVLLERIWGGEAVVDERTVDVHIRWLREKIEPEPSKPVHLLTLRGIGYKFQP
ncbi:MAG: response regulator transcription factor [Armatimonadota bacterium]